MGCTASIASVSPLPPPTPSHAAHRSLCPAVVLCPAKPRTAPPSPLAADCTESNSHFSAIDSRCYSCETLSNRSGLFVAALLGLALLILLLWTICTSKEVTAHAPAYAAFLGRVFKRINSAELSLRSPFKIVCNFYQVAMTIPRTYHVKFPSGTASFLSYFELLGLDLGGVGLPLACVGLDQLRRRLLFSIIAPFGCSVLVFVLVHRRLAILPIVLYVTFFLSPAVSAQAFLAFDCDCFHLNETHGMAYLMADTSVECGWCSPESGEVLPHAEGEFTELLATQRLAWCAMGVSGIRFEPFRLIRVRRVADSSRLLAFR